MDNLAPWEETKGNLKKGFQEFVESLNEVLNDVTALEVNTIIASDITGTKFIAEEAYRNIFFCLTPRGNILKESRKYIQEELTKFDEISSIISQENGVKKLKLPPSFEKDYEEPQPDVNTSDKRPQTYKVLREKLESEYRQIFFEKIKYDGNDSDPQNKNLPPDLPFPYDIKIKIREKQAYPERLMYSKDFKKLLEDSRFLRSLRKLNELKAAADRGDTILAQTIIQLDGDVINRYRKAILKNPNRDLIIKIHNEGVTAGEKQWNGLVDFIVNQVKGILELPRNGRS